MKRLIYTLICVITLSSCTSIGEIGKTVWGNSTRSLEKLRRYEAETAIFKCTFRDCYNAVLSLDRLNDQLEPKTEKAFNVFNDNPIRSFIVVMGVDGNIDTTEVGIFFVDDPSGTKLEITSLATTAKRKVAEAVFKELESRYTKI